MLSEATRRLTLRLPGLSSHLGGVQRVHADGRRVGPCRVPPEAASITAKGREASWLSSHYLRNRLAGPRTGEKPRGHPGDKSNPPNGALKNVDAEASTRDQSGLCKCCFRELVSTVNAHAKAAGAGLVAADVWIRIEKAQIGQPLF